ncbi:MAG TPA: glycoside hydrolase family 20 zincin-like fold domain-containing protein [Bryobacteraceae bacterium]|nr:glycoside hydrolase family 20 zincin-like fold domain-containing protein [Bryobacteraceae bacterium]
MKPPLLLLLLAAASICGAADLTHATVVTDARITGPERKAVALLIDAVEERTRLRWPVAAAVPQAAGPVVMVRRAPPGGGLAPEGYQIRSTASRIEITGNDERGVLFGIGGLLRALEMRRDSVTLPRDLNVTTAPKYALRGHQLGYRPKTNTNDAWDANMWERYIRDLAVFGANAIELIPPRSDDAADSPHFPLPPMRMMIEMSRLAEEYGLECWIWYPAMDPDYSNAATVDAAVREWAEVFRQLPRIDAVFVPGGDPGHTEPRVLMALLEKQAASLKRYHPKATMWLSPQGFSRQWMEQFFGLMDQQPPWLAGVVFGPQVRVNLPELRARIPKRYPIRHYPDITHSVNSQFAVNDWDVAYAQTEEREVVNPRPLDEAQIFRVLQPYADGGFITYSEGSNDDVNKAVWSALGWNPEADVTEMLRDYGRYFIGPDAADAFAQGLLALERNWRGPLLTNTGVDVTLAQFREMERRATPQQKLNWRFQQALYRADYDAYLRARLVDETGRERRALERLALSRETGALWALTAAENELAVDPLSRAGSTLRARVFELAEALFQSVRMQLSVPRYAAIAAGRGANLDLIDRPITNAAWLRRRFSEIRAMESEPARLAAIDEILNWTNPGPGGFYDDLGDPSNRPHLDPGPGFEKDPAFFHTVRTGFASRGAAPWRISWHRHAETLYGNTLRLRYSGLDPSAHYKIRYVEAGDSTPRATRLVANGKFEIHPMQKKGTEVKPVEFAIPPEATAGGALTLEWQPDPDESGNGRFVQISEVWLVRAQL